MSDLEKFLQQAAEKIKQRLEEQQGQTKPPPNRQPPPQPQQTAGQRKSSGQRNQPPQGGQAAQHSRPRHEEPQILDAEVVASPAPKKKRKKQPGSNVTQRGSVVSSNVDMADERMSKHLHDAFDHALGTLNQHIVHPVNDVGTIHGTAASGSTKTAIHVQQQSTASNPISDMLRDPNSVRNAFILSEIFKRKFE